MRKLFFLLLFCSTACTAICQTYISNVTVLDVDNTKLLPGMTVTITNGVITAITPVKKTIVPANADITDGSGKFLMPGMTDAHVHFFQSGGLYTRPDAIDLRKFKPYDKEIEWTHNNMEDFLRRYLQNGITSVIDVGSTINFLQQRDTFQNKSFSPAIYMTGPLITTYEPDAFKKLDNDEPFYYVKTPEEARAMVQKQLSAKPDFIKIWYIAALGNNVEETAKKYLPIVQATIDEAHKNNLRVAVHATERITAQLAVESGCDFLVHGVDDEIVSDAFIQLLKTKKIVLCPTLIVADNYTKTFLQKTNYSYHDFVHSNPYQLSSLFDLKNSSYQAIASRMQTAGARLEALDRKDDSIRMINLKKMADAGVTIASGTDAGNIGTLHATSFQEEMKAMKSAGMSNWQILQSSTINGAKAVGKQKEWGSIAVGKRADLLLLSANPADNLDNLLQIQLIFHRGEKIIPSSLITDSPLALVQRQLNAYNAHNLDAFLEPYAEDIELYNFPGKLLAKGKEQMRKMYDWMKQVPALHCEITNRIIQGNTIIDNEKVTGFGDKPLEAVAIYNIENGKIRRVYFIE